MSPPATIASDAEEPLLRPNPDRFVFHPVQHQDLYDMYAKAMSSYWTPHEPDFQTDVNDWNTKLTDGDRRFLSHVLAFFAGADGVVNENLAMNFYQEIEIPEVRAFYAFQTAIETVHAETYAIMLDTYIRDEAEKNRLLRAIREVDCIAQKAQWAQKYMDRSAATFAERLAAFAIMEGVFFSSAFASIFYMNKRGLMPGLNTANELISRDEALHCEFACALFLKCVNRPSQAKMHAMMTEAARVEEAFVCEAIPVSLIGMSSADMCQYVRFCADRLLKCLGYDPIWRATNPFDFMNLISVQKKANFFERRVTDYNKAGVVASGDRHNNNVLQFKPDGVDF